MSLIQSYRTLRAYRSDPLGFFINCFKEHGHTTFLNIFGKKLLIISQPEDVMYVLKTNASAYSKGRTTKAMGKLLGRGLITNDDPVSWRERHRLIRPLMGTRSVHGQAEKMLTETISFLPEFTRAPETNVLREMNRLTWRIVLQTLFSERSTPEMDLWLEEILEMMETITTKTRSLVPMPFWVPTPMNLRLRAVLKKFDAYIHQLITTRKSGDSRGDLIQLLIDAGAEEDVIRDEMMTFLLAGHETITNTMSWLLIELAKVPSFFPALREEADRFFQTKNFEELESSAWHSALVDEAMRLWPAVWVFMRQAEKEDTVAGHKIGPGTNVVIATYLTHRAPELWERPDEFYPQRFLNKRPGIQGQFLPFGQGPRACIGAQFALMEAKIILATLVHHFDWNLVQREAQKSIAGITLRPANNLQMAFRKRET